jgi:hypothetical protein
VPLRLKIMGEDLVVFRDGSGRAGLLRLHCTHRGTSLEYGLIGERGIRCCYHGWVFDVHALEHLASTDRGVIMLRRIVRDGIRAVAAGRDPRCLQRAPGPSIATACQDTVQRVAREPDAAADERLLRETGRKVALGSH